MTVQRSVFVIAIALFASHLAYALTDPGVSWRLITTPHFKIIYDARQKKLANRYAVEAERAYTLTTQYYPEAPDVTTISLLDIEDTFGGSATYFPYPRIEINPSLVTVDSHFGPYNDIVRLVLSHEYTHILSFQPTHSFWRPLRAIFGNVIVPTGLLPTWYLEGIAVEMETRADKSGRLRLPYYHAIMRALAIDHDLEKESLSRMNQLDIPVWPRDRAYVLGSFMVHEMSTLDEQQQNRTHEKYADPYDKYIHPYLIRRYSSRVPYFLNAPLEERLEQNYPEVFIDMQKRVQQNTLKETQKIEANTETDPHVLERQSFEARSPVISADGTKLAFLQLTPEWFPKIFVLERNAEGKFSFDKNQKPLVNFIDTLRFSSHRISFSPDNTHLVYDADFYFDQYYKFSDLYVVNIHTGSVEQITHGMRALEPTFSPDGKHIAFRQNVPGSSLLAEIDVAGVQEYRVLYKPSAQESRISWPVYLNDNEVAFTEHVKDQQKLLVVNRNTLAVTERLTGLEPQFLSWSKNGLLFSSEITGISNLYLSDRNLQNAVAITNVATRAGAPELDPQTGDVYLPYLRGRGIYLSRIPAQQLKPTAAPKIHLPDTFAWNPEVSEPVDQSQWQEEAYSAGRFLIPRYWIPGLSLSDGGAIISATTGSIDPLARHQYNASLLYDTRAANPSFDVRYRNAQTRVPITLAYSDHYTYLYAPNVVQHSYSGAVNAVLSPLFHWVPLYALQIGWNYRHSAVPRFLKNDINNEDFNSTGPNITFAYNEAVQIGRQISPERGYTVSAFAQHFLKLQDYVSYDRLNISGVTYINHGLLPANHAIRVGVAGIANPRLPSYYLGAVNTGFGGNPLLGNQFVTRGYPSATFLAQTAAVASLEYRFPILNIWEGVDNVPIFARRIHGAVVSDAVTLEGLAYNYPDSRYRYQSMGRSVFLGGGVELKLDLTVGYHFPITLIAGYYLGNQSSFRTAAGDLNVGFGYKAEF